MKRHTHDLLVGILRCQDLPRSWEVQDSWQRSARRNSFFTYLTPELHTNQQYIPKHSNTSSSCSIKLKLKRLKLISIAFIYIVVDDE